MRGSAVPGFDGGSTRAQDFGPEHDYHPDRGGPLRTHGSFFRHGNGDSTVIHKTAGLKFFDGQWHIFDHAART